jgi:3-dehydroquinate synthase
MSGSEISMRLVTVHLGERTYPVHIGRGLLPDITHYLPEEMKLTGKILFVLTDENAKPYAETLKTALENRSGAEAVHVLPVPPGEETKSFRWYEIVLNWMLDSGVTRQSVLFAVGGGVVGDLGGFAAATVLRGIPFVQVPTTLLAQVDSGVGGKTAIDTAQGKNLVGAFYQPVAVICDLDTLETLDKRQRLAGYAEIIKYGLINDAEFFMWLEENGKALCNLEAEPLAQAIEIACRKKADIVSLDELETDVRRLLNLGHTFGHALEAAAGYSGDLLHGEAVAVGMMLAISLSIRLGHCQDEPLHRLRDHLQEIGLPTSIRDLQGIVPHDPQRLVRSMYADKKAETGGLTFVLLKKIGEAFVERRVPEEEVLAVLKQSMHE